jgi:hypothetical protein
MTDTHSDDTLTERSLPPKLQLFWSPILMGRCAGRIIPSKGTSRWWHGWVTQNVEPQTWVAAVQTGTLGYWHDRTINLDGKVNLEALAARQEFGHVLDYASASQIDYIVDWAGVGNWIKRPGPFSESFELVVQDADANLSVMRRKDPRANP